MNRLSLCFATALFCLATPALAGEWTLDGGKVFFYSVKNNNAAVGGTFQVTGGAKGNAFEVIVDLDTLDTDLVPRDISIKNSLFEVAKHPRFVLKGAFPADQLPKKAGDTAETTFEATIHYRGLKPKVSFPMILFRTSDNTIHARTKQTVAIGLGDLGLLGAPLEAMMKLCGHQSILPIAFVTFEGTWKQ